VILLGDPDVFLHSVEKPDIILRIENNAVKDIVLDLSKAFLY